MVGLDQELVACRSQNLEVLYQSKDIMFCGTHDGNTGFEKKEIGFIFQ